MNGNNRREITPRGVTSRDISPRGTTSRDFTPHNTAPRDITPRDYPLTYLSDFQCRPHERVYPNLSQATRNRRNSDARADDLRFYNPRNSTPVRIVADAALHGPPAGTRTRSRFPTVFNNTERAYGHWQTYQGADLNEYPVRRPNETGFDYDRRRIGASRLNVPIHPNDRGRVVRHPPNDAGVIRAITTNNRSHLVGATTHPRGNTRGIVASTYAPLDRQGRIELRQHNEYPSTRSRSEPIRYQ